MEDPLDFENSHPCMEKIIESDNEVNKVSGETVRFIKGYDLVEL